MARPPFVLCPQWSLSLTGPAWREPWHSVTGLAWSPDARTLVVSGVQADEDVVGGPSPTWPVQWCVTAADGAVAWRLRDTDGPSVYAADTSACTVGPLPPGDAVASLSRDGALVCRESDGGERWSTVVTPPGHEPVLVWGGRWLVTRVGTDGALGVIDARSGTVHRTVKGHPRPIVSAALSADGQLLVTGAGDNTLRLWHPASGAAAGRLDCPDAQAVRLALAPDGQRLAAVCWSPGSPPLSLRLFTLARDPAPRTPRPPRPRLRRIALGLGGNPEYAALDLGPVDPARVPTAGREPGGRVPTAGREPEGRVPTEGREPGGRVITATPEGRLTCHRLPDGRPLWARETGTPAGMRLALAPDGRRFAWVSGGDRLVVADARTGLELAATCVPPGWPLALVWAPDSRRVALVQVPAGYGDAPRALRVVEADTGTCEMAAEGAFLRTPVFSPRGDALAFTDASGLWLARATGSARWFSRPTPRALAFSPDGSRLAGADFSLCCVADVADALVSPPMARLRWHHPHAYSSNPLVAWSPNAASVAVLAGNNRAVHVRAAEDGREQVVLTGHTHDIKALAWAPSGARLATGSEDQSVRIWDAASGAETALLTFDEGYPARLFWAGDHRLWAFGAAGTLLGWSV